MACFICVTHGDEADCAILQLLLQQSLNNRELDDEADKSHTPPTQVTSIVSKGNIVNSDSNTARTLVLPNSY